MNFTFKVLAPLLLFLWVVSTTTAEDFPFIGLVTGNHTNLRAAPSLSAEVIFQLPKGFQLYVVAHQGRWYQVQLPVEASVYVAQTFIQTIDGRTKIRSHHVQVRAGAGTAFASLGSLSEGDSVIVRQMVGDWAEIQPSDFCRAWVNDSYIIYFDSSIHDAPKLFREEPERIQKGAPSSWQT